MPNRMTSTIIHIHLHKHSLANTWVFSAKFTVKIHPSPWWMMVKHVYSAIKTNSINSIYCVLFLWIAIWMIFSNRASKCKHKHARIHIANGRIRRKKMLNITYTFANINNDVFGSAWELTLVLLCRDLNVVINFQFDWKMVNITARSFFLSLKQKKRTEQTRLETKKNKWTSKNITSLYYSGIHFENEAYMKNDFGIYMNALPIVLIRLSSFFQLFCACLIFWLMIDCLIDLLLWILFLYTNVRMQIHQMKKKTKN